MAAADTSSTVEFPAAGGSGKKKSLVALTDYRPTFFQMKNENEKTEMFRKQFATVNQAKGTSIEIFCTDSPAVFTCEYKQKIDAFTTKNPWTWSSLVCIVVKDLTDQRGFSNVFCMDLPAFLNIFARRDILTGIWKDLACQVADSWNETNGSAEKVSVRVTKEAIISMDHRRILWTKGQDQTLQLIASSHNFTVSNQSVNNEVRMSAEDVGCQLRYRSGAVFIDLDSVQYHLL